MDVGLKLNSAVAGSIREVGVRMKMSWVTTWFMLSGLRNQHPWAIPKLHRDSVPYVAQSVQSWL